MTTNSSELYIGMLCDSPQGLGVVSWINDNSDCVYMSRLEDQQYFKVKVKDLIDDYHIVCDTDK